MPEIGVRELKTHLSECLRRVKAGERLTVTDRGRAVATLAPVDAAPVPRWLQRMISKGQLRWGGGKPLGLHPGIKSRGKLASKMVLEDRR